MAVLQPFDAWVRHTWCNQEIAGESFYAKAWRPFFPRKLPTAGVELDERALLIREPANRHDRNAVRIEIRVCATPAIVRGNRLNAEVRVFGAQAADLPQAWLLEHANHALVAAPPPAMTGPPSDRMEPATSKAAAAARVARPDRSVSRSVARPDTRPATPPAALSEQARLGEPGWFPDPQGVAPLRYWDGTGWTSRIRMR